MGTNARAEFTDRDGPPWRSGPTAIDLERQELEAVDHGLLAGAARRAIPRREGRTSTYCRARLRRAFSTRATVRGTPCLPISREVR